MWNSGRTKISILIMSGLLTAAGVVLVSGFTTPDRATYDGDDASTNSVCSLAFGISECQNCNCTYEAVMNYTRASVLNSGCYDESDMSAYRGYNGYRRYRGYEGYVGYRGYEGYYQGYLGYQYCYAALRTHLESKSTCSLNVEYLVDFVKLFEY